MRSSLVVLLVASSGCAPVVHELRGELGPGRQPQSQSSFSPELRGFSRVMVLPPSGTARGGFERELSLFEKHFLDAGVTVISPAITGRVVGIGGKDESAQALSDAERALLMARQTGAQAILQVGTFEAIGLAERLLCGQDPAHLEECGPEPYRAAPWKYLFRGPVYRFQGRLINVENGEVMAAIVVTQAMVNQGGATVNVHNKSTFHAAPGLAAAQATYDCGDAHLDQDQEDVTGQRSSRRKARHVASKQEGDFCRERLDATRAAIIASVVQEVEARAGATGLGKQERAAQSPQRFGGIGVVLRMDEFARLIVFKVGAAGPGARAGIHSNDVVLAIDGQPVAGMTTEALTAKVRGEVGSTVELTIQREGAPAPLKFTITREEISASLK